MCRHVSKSAFKARVLDLLRKVEESGEPLIVTDRGRPTVDVRRIARKTSKALKSLRGSVVLYERPVDPAGDEEWEAFGSDRP